MRGPHVRFRERRGGVIPRAYSTPAFTGGQPFRHTGRPGDGAYLPDGSTAGYRGDLVTKMRRLDADLRRR